jgi:lysophospholipase L1-like esterase
VLAGAAVMMITVAHAVAQPRQPTDMPSSMIDQPIVLLGASFAAGWQLRPVSGHPVVNKGVGGDHSFDMVARFDRDVVALGPRAVILWGYVNDIFDAPGGDVDAARSRAQESFEQMIARARAVGIEPIVATEIPIRAKDTWSEMIRGWADWVRGRTLYHDKINEPVARLNSWLREMAARDALLVLDLDAVLRDDSGARSRASTVPDGAHITPAGYDALSSYARPILERHFSPKPAP